MFSTATPRTRRTLSRGAPTARANGYACIFDGPEFMLGGPAFVMGRIHACGACICDGPEFMLGGPAFVMGRIHALGACIHS